MLFFLRMAKNRRKRINRERACARIREAAARNKRLAERIGRFDGVKTSEFLLLRQQMAESVSEYLYWSAKHGRQTGYPVPGMSRVGASVYSVR